MHEWSRNETERQANNGNNETQRAEMNIQGKNGTGIEHQLTDLRESKTQGMKRNDVRKTS